MAAFAVALLFGEVTIRLVAPQNLSGTWSVVDGRGLILNKAGGSARHQAADRVLTYTFNEHHLRGGPIGDAGRRVLVLGDSYTFGWLLAESDAFVARLQAAADQAFGSGEWQFLNGGAGGWGTADCLAFLEEYGQELRPTIVLAVVNAYDIGRSLETGLYQLDDPSTLELREQRPLRKHSHLKQMVNAMPGYQFILEHSHMVQAVRNATVKLKYSRMGRHSSAAAGDGGAPVPREAYGEGGGDPVMFGRALFRRMKRWCDGNHAHLLVTTTGWHIRPYTEDCSKSGDPTIRFITNAPAMFEAEGIPFHDTTPELLTVTGARLSDYTIPNDGHPNEKGAQLMATNIWLWLKPRLDEEGSREGEGMSD